MIKNCQKYMGGSIGVLQPININAVIYLLLLEAVYPSVEGQPHGSDVSIYLYYLHVLAADASFEILLYVIHPSCFFPLLLCLLTGKFMILSWCSYSISFHMAKPMQSCFPNIFNAVVISLWRLGVMSNHWKRVISQNMTYISLPGFKIQI